MLTLLYNLVKLATETVIKSDPPFALFNKAKAMNKLLN